MPTKRNPIIWVATDQSLGLPPDTYVVSNYGDCKNIKTKITKNVKPNKAGYINWGFYLGDGKIIKIGAHIIIATSFKLPKKKGQTTVDHIDRNRSNNCLHNLRWASPSEQGKNKTPQTNYNKSKIEQYTLSGKLIKTWSTNKEASQTLKIRTNRISDVCCGRLQSAGGFIWKYAKSTDLFGEIWKAFQRYFISSHGRVKTPRGAIKKQQSNGGYYLIQIGNKKYLVSILVCTLFHGEKPTDKHTVDHIDRNPLNNHKDNLRWATRIEQATNTKTVKKINQICPTTNKVLGTFNSGAEAARELGIKGSTSILRVCKGVPNYKTCAGFIFKFAE